MHRLALLPLLALTAACDPTVEDWSLKEATGLFAGINRCVCGIDVQESGGLLGDKQRPFGATCSTRYSGATGLTGLVELIFRRYDADDVPVLTQGKRVLMSPEVLFSVTEEGHGARGTMTADVELTHQLPVKERTYYGLIVHGGFMPAWNACDDTGTCEALPESTLTDFRIACEADFIGDI